VELRDNSGTFSIAAASDSNEANNDDDDDGIMIVFTHNPFNYFLLLIFHCFQPYLFIHF